MLSVQRGTINAGRALSRLHQCNGALDRRTLVNTLAPRTGDDVALEPALGALRGGPALGMGQHAGVGRD